jgi:hypothetical protein
MKEIDATIRAAIKVVRARREARRAAEDGASEEAQKRYGAAFSKALDGLEHALAALAKKNPKPSTQTPFDWSGLAKSAVALARLVRKVRTQPLEQVVDVIDAEVIE